MTFTLDPEVAGALAPMFAAMAGHAPPPVGDGPSRRAMFEDIFAMASTAQPIPTDVRVTDYPAAAGDGCTLLLRWYARDGAQPGSAALYLHGGDRAVSRDEDRAFDAHGRSRPWRARRGGLVGLPGSS